jgi:hypothetical protein
MAQSNRESIWSRRSGNATSPATRCRSACRPPVLFCQSRGLPLGLQEVDRNRRVPALEVPADARGEKFGPMAGLAQHDVDTRRRGRIGAAGRKRRDAHEAFESLRPEAVRAERRFGTVIARGSSDGGLQVELLDLCEILEVLDPTERPRVVEQPAPPSVADETPSAQEVEHVALRLTSQREQRVLGTPERLVGLGNGGHRAESSSQVARVRAAASPKRAPGGA